MTQNINYTARNNFTNLVIQKTEISNLLSPNPDELEHLSSPTKVYLEYWSKRNQR